MAPVGPRRAAEVPTEEHACDVLRSLIGWPRGSTPSRTSRECILCSSPVCVSGTSAVEARRDETRRNETKRIEPTSPAEDARMRTHDGTAGRLRSKGTHRHPPRGRGRNAIRQGSLPARPRSCRSRQEGQVCTYSGSKAFPVCLAFPPAASTLCVQVEPRRSEQSRITMRMRVCAHPCNTAS